MTKAAELAKMGEVLTNSQIGGRRNIIINGGMQVAQRGADNLNITSASGGAYACDRFKLYLSLGGTAQFDLQQVAEAPNESGLSKSLKLSCDVTDTLTANHYLFLTYRIEGQDVQHLKKGTSSAESVTLSFWLKSNKATSGQVNLRDVSNTRMISKTYTVSASDTWQYITLTFDGDTSGILTNDNANRFAIEFFLDSGTTYSSGATPASWEATSSADRNATNFGLVSSTDNYWQITGVQLEVGEQATPFEHRSFGEELALCQRYFYDVATGNNKSFAMGAYYNSPLITSDIRFPVTMRTTPSMSFQAGTDYYIAYGGNTADTFNTFTNTPRGSPNGIAMDCDGNGVSGTLGHGCNLSTNNASAYIHASAEL